MTSTESLSETEISSADRASAEPSKHRTIAGTIKGLFRDAVKAITRRDEEEMPEPRRRRSGETAGEFRRLARNIARRFDLSREFRQRAAITSRYLPMPAEVYAAATAYLSTFDMLNHWNNDTDSGSDFGDGFDADQNHLSPHP